MCEEEVTLKIVVDDRNIQDGVKRNCARCPVALAMREAAGDAGIGDVGITASYLTLVIRTGSRSVDRLYSSTPTILREVMSAFDEGFYDENVLRWSVVAEVTFTKAG